jgi:hypothetical protein
MDINVFQYSVPAKTDGQVFGGKYSHLFFHRKQVTHIRAGLEHFSAFTT